MSRTSLNFVYLRDTNNNPAVAIALLTVPGSSKVSFQIATRNPKDAFNKAHARAAAGGRLTKYPITIDTGVVDEKQTEIVQKIVNHLFDTHFEGVKHHGPITRNIVERYISY